ncbi:MAG: serine hydrolase domain-containing protein [Ferruginibacter sp.]
MKIRCSFLLLLLINTFIINTSLSQTSAQQLKDIETSMPVIDSLFRQYAAKNNWPGMAYGLVANGRLIHTGNTGYTDADKKILATPQSAFRIASMTKSLTAMAILKLRDEGKLQLDNPVYLYIPEMKQQHYLTTDAAPATIRNLLTHTAGFPEDNPWGDRQLAITDAEMIRMIKNGISFSNVPGIAYEYSNIGFAMLGYIIKKVSHQSYQKYISDHILVPLGMTHTYWDYATVPADKLAHGYRWLNGKWLEQPLLKDGAYGAMGGLITSMEDFGKYVALCLSAWPPQSGKETGPVKRSSLREMQQAWTINTLDAGYKYPDGRLCPVVFSYGYGLRISKDCDNKVTVGHSGGLPGFGSDWKIMPDYGIGVISFSNLTYARAGFINTMVLDTLITLANLQPRKLPVSPILNKRKDELIKLLPGWNDAAATGIFAENFFLDYFPDSLSKEATALFNKAGKILHVSEFVPTNNLRGYFIMEGEKTDIKVSFTLTPENPPLIQEYRISEIKKK